MYEYGDTLQPGYGDPYSNLAVGGVQQNPAVTTAQVPVGGYDPVEFQKQIARITQAARTKSFGANGELTKQLDQYGEDGPQYSPQSLDYFNAVNDYLSNNGTGYNLSTHNTASYDPQKQFYAPITDEQAQAFAAQPLADQFVANFGYTGKDPTNWGAGNLEFSPNDQYRIVDRATGQVLYTGTGYGAGDQISKLASGLTDSAGNQANWSIQKADPSGNWTQQYEHVPEDNGFGTFLKLALALAAPILAAPASLGGLAGASGLFGLGTAGGMAAGAGLGSVAGGIANGDSIGDILKSAALAGGLTYAGGSLGGAASGGGTAAGSAGGGLSNIASGLGTVGADGITVLAPSLFQAAAPIVGSVAGAASDLSVPKGSNVTPADDGGILVSATRLQTAADAIKAGATIGSLAAQGFTTEQIDAARQLADSQISSVAKTPTETPLAVPNVTTPPQTAPDTGGIEVIGQKPTPPAEPSFAVPIPALSDTTALPDTGGIEVVAKKPPEQVSDYQIPVPPLTLPPSEALGTPETKAALDNTSTKSTLNTISNVLQGTAAASALAGALGVGSSSSGGSALGTIPAGLAADMATPAIFHSALPAAQSMYGGTGTGGTGAGSTGAGASSSINNWIVPYATSARDAPTMSVMPTVQSVQDAMNRAATMGVAATNPMAVMPVGKAHGGAMGYAQGGSDAPSFAVQGPGTGRSDSVPANLSDGEYVMDAETVALLGDGSSKAGADKLDKMRIAVRKQKGKNLAQGKFSVKAKEPQAYLSGGRI